MKLKPTLSASLFAIIAALSLSASAAPAAAAGASTALDAGATVEKAAPQKQMKRHSHAQEKTGFAQQAPVATPNKPNAAKDKSMHFHPRDGK